MTPSSEASGELSVSATGPVPRLLRDLVHERVGIYFEDDRAATMLEKLQDRARLHGCASFLDYYYILKYNEKGPDEWHRVMDALSVQETYFWREHDQITALVERIVPAWFNVRADTLRIWSSACASGEEPYSLAIALREAGWHHHPIEILATDASEAALERARQGRYRERSFRTLPAHLRNRYFARNGEVLQLGDEIKAAVQFRWANLVDPPSYAEFGPCHVVYCRNVFIYFSAQSIRNTVAAFARLMPERGHLFVGASESLLKLTTDFELTELGSAFAYIRTSGRNP